MRKFYIVFVIIMLCAMSLFIGCKGDDENGSEASAARIETESDSMQILHYTKERLKYKLVGIGEDDAKNLSIKSRNDLIAVYENGYVMGVGEGETEIDLVCGDISKSVSVTVISNVNKPTLRFDKDQVAIYLGGNLQVSANVIFQGNEVGFSEFVYSVENPNVATVDATGNIRGLSVGTTYLTVTCRYCNTDLINSIPVRVNPLICVDFEKIVSEISLYTSDITGGDTQTDMPAKIVENGESNDSAAYTILEVDENGDPADSGYIEIVNDDIFAKKAGTAYIMASYEAGSGEVYNSRIIKIEVRKPLLKFDGMLEIDLHGERSVDISPYASVLSINESIIGVRIEGERDVICQVNGNIVEGLVGSEKCTLIFEGDNYDTEAEAVIYTLKINGWDAFRQLGTTLENNKVESGSGGYVSGGYYVLTTDLTAAGNDEPFSPAFYIADSGNANNGFNGVFDGQGHSIEGIYTYSQRIGSGDKADTCAWGMFSTLAKGGVIRNVSITAGRTTETNTLFGKHCHGTVENVRIHIEQATFYGEKSPLFDYSVQSGSVIRNVFVTFGTGVNFNGVQNGLITSLANANITIEGLYVVGGYACANGDILTWNKQAASNANTINAMTSGGVKYGAYFANAEDFTAGIETIAGEKQTATDLYKDQIASLFDADIWDLTGDLPKIKTGSSSDPGQEPEDDPPSDTTDDGVAGDLEWLVP